MAPVATYRASVEAMRNLTGQAGLWELADALLAEIPQGASRLGFEAMRAACEAAGVKARSVSALRQYRDTAVHWPPATRIPGVSFTAHRAAMRNDHAAELLADLAAVSGPENVTVQVVEQALAALSPRPVVNDSPTAPTVAEASTADLIANLAARFAKASKKVLTEARAAGPQAVAGIQALGAALTEVDKAQGRKAKAWTAKPKVPATQVAADGILGGVRR